MSKSRSQEGKCFLVGAGPGDLGLVTLRAKELLERADVIVYDALVNPEILDWAPVDAEIIFAGKRAGEKTFSQDEINALLIEKSRLGKNVVRLKGGDPFTFGRGGEEAEALAAAGIDFEVVPGITSAIAAPAYAGIPVTHRDQNSHVTFFTGHEDPTKGESAIDFDALAKLGGTQVMLMGMDRLSCDHPRNAVATVATNLPVALVRLARWDSKKRLLVLWKNRQSGASAAGFEAPAVAIFGDVVSLRKNLNWFENRPLFGKRIVVTRTRNRQAN